MDDNLIFPGVLNEKPLGGLSQFGAAMGLNSLPCFNSALSLGFNHK